ncbi:MAG: glutathione S-transferase [Alphaproteobacteria bacterium]|jgi:glutathione S-transferase|nr:glutathione S-transferase [Alphaproteobacteria bacterium]MDP6814999.1 glutathione S-transferase [Alphaproteobacteria bacterium]
MKFYDCSTAPSPRRVRIFIAEKDLEIDTVDIDMRKGEQLGEAFRAINPHCTVPVLELDDGTRLTTTAGIWRYLEAEHPEPSLLGATAKEQGLVADLQWRIEFDGMLAIAEALRNSAPPLKDRALTGPINYAQIPELAERGLTRLGHFLAGVDGMIGDKPFVAGDRYTVADIDLLVTVDFAGWLKQGLPEDAANAQRWYQSVSERPSAKL